MKQKRKDCMSKPKLVLAHGERFFSMPLIRALEKAGFEVIFCDNASKVMQKFMVPPESRPFMLVSDCFLPPGDNFNEAETCGSMQTGQAIYKRLRKMYSTLPVILHTTRDSDLDDLEKIKDPHFGFFDPCAVSFNKHIVKAVEAIAGICFPPEVK